MVDVALGVNAEEIASHAKGDGEGIGDDPLSCDVDDFFADIGMGFFEEDGDDLGVGFRLVVGREDDIFSSFAVACRFVEDVLVRGCENGSDR